MTAKDFLYRPQNLYKQIIVVRERIGSLRLSMLPSAVRYDKDPVQTSPEDPLPEYAAQLDKLERVLAELVKNYNEASGEVYDAICQIPTMDVRVYMAKRYVSGKSWPVIAEECHWSKSTIVRLNRTGVRFVANLKNVKVDTT